MLYSPLAQGILRNNDPAFGQGGSSHFAGSVRARQDRLFRFGQVFQGHKKFDLGKGREFDYS